MTHRVTFKMPDGSATAIEVSPDQHVLDAALQAGVDLPYSCLQGWCLTCAVRIVSGRLDQRDSRRYYEADREEGFGLICTGRPDSDLVIEPFARDAMRSARAWHHLPHPKGDWGH
jgi:ferredoxin